MVPRVWLGIVLLVLVLAGPAWAHSVRIFVSQESDDAWSGRVFLPGGGKPAGATVRLLAADGSQVAEMRTDANGGFRYEGRLAAGAYTFRVELDAGHRAEWPIEVGATSDTSDSASAAEDAPAATRPATPLPADLDARISRAVAREVAPLRQELAEYRAAVRAGDVLAGLGIIAAAAGAGFFLLARRERRRAGD